MNSQDVILGMLLKGPKSGYDMKQKFQSTFSFFYDASFGTIYPTLSKMEALGYITKESIIQEGKPNKNIYSITPSGREKFQEYIHSPMESEVYRSDFLMRLFFGEFVDKAVIIGWFERKIEELEASHQSLSTGYEQFIHHSSPTQALCAEFGMEQLKMSFAFLKKGLEKLHNLEE
ncbi:hypothetical protein BVG16_19690 [Paenibacillus selenitireducens]|uniref:PadR family transcriptional regulator n=1 Tax=Paenibacillus selenitireducens TaxID=1324314 RepID=A0A1T2X6Q6_9BACL|nr:helix-turn-helix transcriptional regulator [Paenibacillus selenitireducens]OPA75568.1 hypothetical protein BVG16_19690 [Paenibacillus selenitireducens]